MRKRYAHAAMLLAATVLFLLPALPSQGFIEEISSDAFENGERPPVVFNHDEHNAAAELEDQCWFCHHMDGSNPTEGESSEGMPCSDCHATDGSSVTGLMDAYHQQCIGCHEDKGAGPLACGECHVK